MKRTRIEPATTRYLYELGYDKSQINPPLGPFLWVRNQSLSPMCVAPVVWPLSIAFPELSETIEDEEGTTGTFRNCLHERIIARPVPPQEIRMTWPEGGSGNAWASMATSSDVTAAHALRSVPNVDMDAMAEEALAYMLPSLNEGSSLINFVHELKDLKPDVDKRSMIQRVLNKRSASKGLKGLFSPSSHHPSRKAFVKDTIKRITGAHLQTEFGIVPFIRDVVGMCDELQGLAYRLIMLKKHANKPLVRHYKRVIPESPGVRPDRHWKENRRDNGNWTSVPNVHADKWGGGERPRTNSIYRRSRWIKRPVYHATMRYSYQLPMMDSKFEEVLAMLDVLGVRLDPSIVWNATRWTFLVDWVVDVSSFLRSFARDNYPIVTTIGEFCHSLAWHREVQIGVNAYVGAVNLDQLVLGGAPNIISQPYSVVFDGSHRYYNRVRANPSIHSVSLRRPDLRKGALSGSLLLNKAVTGRLARAYQRG